MSADDFDTILTGELAIPDRATRLGTYLPELAPGDRERVDGYV